MRIAATLCLLGIAACGSTTPDAEQGRLASVTLGDHAPVHAFVPPIPAGCAGAGDYDVCLALHAATPLAVRVALPRGARPNAVAVVHIHRVAGERAALDLDQVKFKTGGAPELLLYFQVHPGAYRIVVGVDADGDGNPEGPADDLGWSAPSPDVPVLDEAGAAIVDVGATPIETAFTLASRE